MQNYQINLFFTTKADANLAFHVNDDKSNVINNHKKLAIKHNYDYTKLVHMKQIHSDIVHIISDDDNFDNPPTCDALITNKKDIPLMVMVADCTPLVFYDANRGVIAVVHAGRQGAFKNIVKNTLNTMHNKFNSKIQEIKVTIGASICQKCYEVAEETLTLAKKLKLEYAIKYENDKYYLNINKILLTQLSQNNIQNKNITLNNECSSCQNNKYFSYRKEGQTGRFSAVIILK